MSLDRSKLRWNGWGLAAHVDTLAARDEVWAWLAGQLAMPALLATPARTMDDCAMPDSKLDAAMLHKLAELVGVERVQTDRPSRAFHACDKDYAGLLALRAGELANSPDAVVSPRSGEEALAVILLADELGIAVQTGNGVEQSKKPKIVLDLSGMDRILDITSDSATCEAGIAGSVLEKALRARGSTLGHRPEDFEFSTLGEWIDGGETASALRYGEAKDWVQAIKIATPKGMLHATSSPMREFVVGSHGRLGIAVEARVRIRPLPPAMEARHYLFPDFAGGQAALRRALAAELPIAGFDLSDESETSFWQSLAAVGQKRGWLRRLTGNKMSTAAGSFLSVRFGGPARAVEYAVAQFESIAAREKARHVLPPPLPAFGYIRDAFLERGAGIATFRFASDWEKLETLMASLRSALDKALEETAPRPGARGVLLGNISALPNGGVCLRANYVFPRLLSRDMEQWKKLRDSVSAVSQAHELTDALSAEVAQAIKNTLDPKGTLIG